MVIIELMGGLGNQLQQYALYRKLVRMGKKARLDTSWFQRQKDEGEETTSRELELDRFDRLVYETCNEEEKAELIGADGFSGKLRRKLLPGSVRWFHESEMYHPEIFDFEDMYISGYFACEKYYSDILYDLRERIQFPPSGNPLNREIAQEMEKCQSVSLHIRRGDYLNAANKDMFGGICTEAYYKSAQELMLETFPDARFFVFSDDAEYAKSHYRGGRYTIIDWNSGEDSFYDMQLMSLCRHNICANSTFSFWGARLNAHEDKMMVRPTLHKNSQSFKPALMYDLWKGWNFIDRDGRRFLGGGGDKTENV